MRNPIILILIAGACLVCASALAQLGSGPKQKNQTVERLETARSQKIELKYLLFLPKDYSGQGAKTWPLILFLHGAGERGSDIWKVAVHGPPKYVGSHPDFPFIVVSPQCPEGQIWSNDALLALLDDVTSKCKVDRSRIYLTGLSMGGYGTWNLGLTEPDKFAAIVPICGGGQLINILLANGTKGNALRSLGIWAFHGGKDTVVPLEESQRMVNMLKKVGVSDIQLTIYPEAGHDSWTEAYNNPALYEWLLKHQRKP